MNKFEIPIQFELEKTVKGRVTKYLNVMEVSQGDPNVGDVSIDGDILLNYRFNDPILHQGEFIYLPLLVKSIFNTGFKISKLKIETKKVDIISKMNNLIYLDSIYKNGIYYFIDMQKSGIYSIEI